METNVYMQCPYCKEAMLSFRELDRHMAEKHNGKAYSNQAPEPVTAPLSTGSRGGKRKLLPYSLTQIPISMLERIGAIYLEGEPIYGRGNWRKFANDPEMKLETVNHAIAHLLKYAQELETGSPYPDVDGKLVDHLAKVGWAVATLCECERIESETSKEPF